MRDAPTTTVENRSHRSRLVWVSILTLLVLYTYWQLMRVQQGHLFALALPWDRPPTATEVEDARLSAQTFLYPALVAVLAVGVVFAFVIPRLHFPIARPSKKELVVLALFMIAVLADLVTTLHFFHQQGVDFELHPGIRLFGYAYGLTIGPVAGKLLQAVGILSLSLVAGRFGIVLLLVVTLVYGLAAIYNVMPIPS